MLERGCANQDAGTTGMKKRPLLGSSADQPLKGRRGGQCLAVPGDTFGCHSLAGRGGGRGELLLASSGCSSEMLLSSLHLRPTWMTAIHSFPLPSVSLWGLYTYRAPL